ncbi:hypothetical protein [Gilvimarinus sp. DA14]|uniref:hypothetical protein n=1 Tax=Gilvimarinus sp. DA14 TaxID=2956798 RepID=UPI0020B6C0D1|nr:hypothetical protein [Gilvimarinus sp. DA14]UTF61344.1 hypothetical protein NHM04_05955 [Gilvimarinus sp. DA14]
MQKSNKKLDPDEMLFTLDQLEQTTEIMSKVVSRLKRQLMQLQQAESDREVLSKPVSEAPTPAKQRRTLH